MVKAFRYTASMLSRVSRLHSYPHWLPVEKLQITFYCQRLESLSKSFEILAKKLVNGLYDVLYDRTLTDLISRILELKNLRTSAEFLNFKDPPDLNLVGERLASNVALIYNDCVIDCGQASQDFAFKLFYFDRNRFEEQPQVEVFIGFQEEEIYLLQKLVSITKKQLEVISIVGMAGLGKTTLAKRLYNDPYVVSYFYIRAWVVCSHVYNKRDLLLVILRSINEITDDVQRMNDNMLAHVLYRALKGRRYLIVIDDVWSSSAWDDIKRCFPDDNNGIKIMLTTWFKDVALHSQSDGNPLCLRFLTEEESFNLFTVKVSRTGYLLDDLSFIGKSITKTCRGLPLAIVVIAGLLKGNFNVDWWEQVAESVSSYIATDETQYMDTLALSYNHLPRHLRPCFLSFGAFPEDYDIPVRKLIWLWIAEGFIPQDETEKSLEGVAKDYLMDLISRSLVCVGKRGSNGAIKTCRIHDLLRDLALRDK